MEITPTLYIKMGALAGVTASRVLYLGNESLTNKESGWLSRWAADHHKDVGRPTA